MSRGGYTSAIDMWSAGCIFGELLHRVGIPCWLRSGCINYCLSHPSGTLLNLVNFLGLSRDSGQMVTCHSSMSSCGVPRPETPNASYTHIQMHSASVLKTERSCTALATCQSTLQCTASCNRQYVMRVPSDPSRHVEDHRTTCQSRTWCTIVQVTYVGSAATPQLQVAPLFAIHGMPKTPASGWARSLAFLHCHQTGSARLTSPTQRHAGTVASLSPAALSSTTSLSHGKTWPSNSQTFCQAGTRLPAASAATSPTASCRRCLTSSARPAGRTRPR